MPIRKTKTATGTKYGIRSWLKKEQTQTPYSGPMMNRNVMQVLKDFKGKPIKDETDRTVKPEDRPDLTLRALLLCAVGEGTTPDNPDPSRRPSFKDSYARFKLGTQIAEKEVISITPEECTLLKSLVASISMPLICGQACEMLDSDPVPVLPSTQDGQSAPKSEG